LLINLFELDDNQFWKEFTYFRTGCLQHIRHQLRHQHLLVLHIIYLPRLNLAFRRRMLRFSFSYGLSYCAESPSLTLELLS